MTKRIFATESKAWIIEQEKLQYTTYYGKSDFHDIEELRNTTKEFESEEKCGKEVEKAIASKLKSGYEEILLSFPELDVYDTYRLQQIQKGQGTYFNVRHYDSSPELLAFVCQLENLEELNISSADPIPDTLDSLKNLRKLILSLEGQAIPESMGALVKLEYLEVQSSGASLPASVGQLKNLKEVNLHIKSGLEIPLEFGLLPETKKLNLYFDDKLGQFPEALYSLLSLEELKVSGFSDVGELTFDERIGQLSNLKDLEIYNCNLTQLPDEISALQQLEELDLGYNKLDHIPKGVLQLKNLKELELTSNPLKKIDPEFVNLTSLEDFDFNASKIEGIPQSALDSIQDIQAYFNAGEKVNEVNLEVPPLPSNYKEILADKQKRLDATMVDLRDEFYRDSDLKKLEEVYQFITGATNTLPESLKSSVRRMEELIWLFNPIKDWCFIDDRLLSYICQGTFYYLDGDYARGFHEDFFSRWYVPQLHEEKEGEDTFGFIVEKLAEREIPPWATLTAFLDETSRESLTREDGCANSLGKFMLPQIEEDPLKVCELIEEHGNPNQLIPLFPMLSQKTKDVLIPLITGIRKYKGYDGSKHVPTESIRDLCNIETNVDKEAMLLDRLANTDCVSCSIEVNAVLVEEVSNTYRSQALACIQKGLKEISRIRNEDSYRFKWYKSNSNIFEDDTADFIRWTAETFQQDVLQDLKDYVANTKAMNMDVVTAIVETYGQDALEVAMESLKMSDKSNQAEKHFKKAFSVLEGLDFSPCIDRVWEFACLPDEKIAASATNALASQPFEKVVDKASELLTGKKSAERLAAVSVLSSYRKPEVQSLLRPLLDGEKSLKVRDIASQYIYKEEDPSQVSKEEMLTRIARLEEQGKLKQPAFKWLSKLPKLQWRDGETLSETQAHYIFQVQKSFAELRVSYEAAPMYHLLDENCAEAYAGKLFELMCAQREFKATSKALFPFLGRFGNTEVAKGLGEYAISQTNTNACAVLGLMASKEAALALSSIIRYFSVKYPNVRNAAEEAFEQVAEAMRLSYFELKDSMLPNFDFDNNRGSLDVDGETYQMYIGSRGKFEFINPKGKVVKSISKASKEVKAKLKEMNASLKSGVQEFTHSLESYMVSRRTWKGKDWHERIFQQAIPNFVAQRQIWLKNGETSFICTPENLLTNVEDEEVDVNADDDIQIVHPLLLSDLAQWKEYVDDNEIEQLIPQLKRNVITYHADHGDKSGRLHKGKSLYGATFKSRAQKRGWRKGSIGDGGGVLSYCKVFDEYDIEVFIETNDLSAQDYGETVTLGNLYFTRLSQKNTGSYFYEPYGEKDERNIQLKEVPELVYSETLNDLNVITQG